MKRRALLVALLLCAPHLPSFAATPPKAGAICSKAGITKNYNGKKYTCTKSGKKLIWSKGTLIKVAQPMPTPTPTRTPIPTATPTPTTTPTLVTEPSPSPSSAVTFVPELKVPDKPTSFADLEERYQGIPYAVWEEIQSNLRKHQSTNLKINFIFGPNTPQRYPNQLTIDAVTLGSRVMGSQKQPEEVRFIQYNKQDVSWARAEAGKYLSPFKLGISLPDQASEKCAGIDCDGAVTNIASDIGLVLVGVPTPVNRFNIQRFGGQTDLHEYTHAVQGMIFKGKTQSPPPVLLPCWYSEGQPQAVSISTLAKSVEDYVNIRKSWITDNKWLLKDYEPETIQEFLRNNMKLPCDSISYPMIYSLGYIVMDALVSVGGIDKTFDLLTVRTDGLSFEESFKRVYGVGWDDASIALSKAVSKVYKAYRK